MSEKRAISDLLHTLLGYTDSTLSSFLTSVSTSSKNYNAILSILIEYEVKPVSGGEDALRVFAKKAYKACHGAEGGKVEKVSNADMIWKGKNEYSLLLDDDNESKPSAKTTSKAQKTTFKKVKSKKEKTSKKDKRKKKRRKTSDGSSSSDSDSDSEEDETKVIKPINRREREWNEEQERLAQPEVETEVPVLSEEEQKKIDDENDIKERDEFTKRLNSRDAKNTKSQNPNPNPNPLNTDSDSILQTLLSGGSVADGLGKGNTINLERLRGESRMNYLERREAKELELLEFSIKDEEELFKGVVMTEKEVKRMETNKKILEIVKGRKKYEEKIKKGDEDDGEYHLPKDNSADETMSRKSKQESTLTSRYKNDVKEKSEQELWEEGQTANANMKFGSSRGKSGVEGGYEYVFEDQIEFVLKEVRKGKKKNGEDESSNDSDSDNDGNEYNDDKQAKVKKEEEENESKQTLPEYDKIQIGRKKLPVYAYREEFLQAMQEHQILVVVGETGSGKTTQIPQFLHEVGYSKLGKIACTQPRRVAAMSVASRVSQEMGCKLGQEVGYSIRFEDCTSEKTIIQYMTDGMLLRQFLTEPDLKSFSCLIIDEAHERTLHTDILFGLVKDLLRFRKDLKLIISSATLDAEKFSTYLDDCSIFMIPGRMYPVEILYTKSPEADYVDAAVVTVLQIHVSQPVGSGDILVFFTGQEEIETATEILTQRTKGLGSRISELIICPIYANLPSEQQAKIFEKTPPGSRKVVLGTNIAETSLTIDGICYVIDTGFSKQKNYNPKTGMESLVVAPISQAASQQRAGRAGRTQPGKCFRLFTAWSFSNELEENTVPEIMRTNMGNVVLQLKALGINDLLHFDFMDAPPPETLMRAFEQLYALGALNDKGELTKLGRRMAEFPLEPMLSKTVIISEKFDCVSEILSMVSMLSIGTSVFYRPKDKAVHADTARLNFARGGGGDQISLLRCYSEWRDSDYSTQWCFENYIQAKSIRKARDVREQLEGLCERVEIEQTSCGPLDNDGGMDKVLKSYCAGFFFNVAKLDKSGSYKTLKKSHQVYVHPSSVLAKDEVPDAWLCYFELTFTSKEFMRQVCPIKGEWLRELAPHYVSDVDVGEIKSKKMPNKRMITK